MVTSIKRCSIVLCGLLLLWPGLAMAAPAAPPVPSPYDMGVVANGNFEAGGGSLAGWTTAGNCSALDLSGDHVAHLWHADSDGGAYMAPASLSQSLYVPTDASDLTFLYYCSMGSFGSAEVNWGGTHVLGDTFGSWQPMTLPTPAIYKGSTAQITFGVTSFLGTDDLYIDYVSLVPEPGTMLLLASGVTLLIARRRKS